MSRQNEIYSLGEGYQPFIYKNESHLFYCFPVSSGHAELLFEFRISGEDLDTLKSSLFRFKLFYFVLFFEAQSTFGSGVKSSKKFTINEFEAVKKIVFDKPEDELKLFIKQFSKKKNLAENYFEWFCDETFD